MRRVKLYPSADNFQRSNDDEVQLSWAIAYLSDLMSKVPDHEQPSAVLKGWKGLSVEFDHKQSPEEVFREQIAEARQLLISAPREGLDARGVERLKQLLLL